MTSINFSKPFWEKSDGQVSDEKIKINNFQQNGLASIESYRLFIL